MFPAPAGMSPRSTFAPYTHLYVPRTRGDEPVTQAVARDLLACSPHPRG